MIWLGLTGGIASGKSTVASYIREFGISVLDADFYSRKALERDSEGYFKTVETFGQEILSANGDIDRLKLGQLIFQNKSLRESLENIVHPLVREAVGLERKRLEQMGTPMAVYDVPLLFEKKMRDQFDEVILVYCDLERQVERLIKRNQSTRAEALLRIKSQTPLKDKIDLASRLIENNSTLIDLKAKTEQLIKDLGMF